ncbi:MAG: S26 family signal peptidase [Bacteroidota bacterium]
MPDAPPAPGFSRRWFVFVGAVLAVVLLVFLFIRRNDTPSVPEGVYLRLSEWMMPGEPAVGDFAMACLPDAEAAFVARERGYLDEAPWACASGVVPVLKRVAAVEGQTVEVTEAGVFVDGARVGEAPPTADSQGRPIAPAYGMYRLGAGEAWLASDIPNGYDSRYAGPLVPEARAWLLVEL